MVWTIARKDLLENLRSLKTLYALLVCILLFSVSFLLMRADYLLRLRTYEQVSAPSGSRYSRVDPAVNHRPTTLSILVRGTDDMGLTVQRRISGFWFERAPGVGQQNPLFALFPSPDFSLIVEVVMSLLTILLAYNAISGEKQNGTLRLILSHSVPRSVVLLGKLLAAWIGILIPFLGGILSVALLTSICSGVRFSSSDWISFSLMALASALYLLLFAALSLLVSSSTHRPGTSLLLLIFLWVGAAFVLPNLSALLAKRMVSIPSVQEHRAELFAAKYEYLSPEARRARRMSWSSASRAMKKIEDAYQMKVKNQTDMMCRLSRISPVACFKRAAAHLARTSLADERRYVQALSDYEYRVRLNVYGETKAEPAFTYGPRPLREGMRDAVWDIGMLALYTIVLFAGAYLKMCRYDVR